MPTDLYAWTRGPADAPPLVCLHGIGSCADAFLPQLPLVDRCSRRVVAWDAPGYRHSPDPDDEPGIDGYADAAADLIAGLGADRADVLGVSWGGVIATRLALRHPDRVRSLVLADSSPGAGTSPSQAESMRARATALAETDVAAFATDRSPLLVHPDTDPELVDEVARLMADSVRLPSYQWAANAMAETDHRDRLAAVGQPTLVVVGDEDRVTGRAAAEILASGIPAGELVVIDRAGHLANQEQPDAFNQAVAAFLDRVDGSNPS